MTRNLRRTVNCVAVASLALALSAANGASGQPSVSQGGRVAFSSDASDFVAGDTNAMTDVFVRDHVTMLTERVSVGAQKIQADGPSRAPAIE